MSESYSLGSNYLLYQSHTSEQEDMNTEYEAIVEAINRIKCEDDVHDFAGNITQWINEAGSCFEFDADTDKSIELEIELHEMLDKRCKEVSSPEFYRMHFSRHSN